MTQDNVKPRQYQEADQVMERVAKEPRAPEPSPILKEYMAKKGIPDALPKRKTKEAAPILPDGCPF